MIRQQRPTIIGEFAGMLKAAALLVAVVIVAYAGYHFTEWWTHPVPPPTMQEIENDLFWGVFWKWVLVGASVFFGCTIILSVSIRLKRYWLSSSYIMPDRNGNLPVVKDKYVTVDDYGHKHIYESWTDLETGLTTGLHKNGTVQLFGGAQTSEELQLVSKVSDRRHRSAENAQMQRNSFINGNTPNRGKAPTVGQLRQQAGVFEAERSKVELQAQLIEQRLVDAQNKPDAKAIEDVVLATIPPIENAIKHSEGHKWIMGANEYKQMAIFSPKQDGHLAIFGSNGSGKTKSSAQMAALYALDNGWNVIALDGKGGVDWLRFGKAGIMHAHVLDGDNIDYFISCISDEMDRRYQMLSDRDYESLHEAHDSRDMLEVPKTLIIFEELGANVLGAPKPQETAKALGVLMRKLRASGIHLVLIEQSPDKGMLTNGIKSNALYFVYNLPGHQGKVVNASDSVKYLSPGRFECNGDEYQAWNVYEDMPLSGAVEWPDLFGVAPSAIAKEVNAELPTGSDKLSQVVEYIIANPDTSKSATMVACGCSDSTVAKARRIIKNSM